MYFLLEPTNTNAKNEIPASPSFFAQAGAESYHLQNVALLPWYTGSSAGLGSTYSFPDASVLTAAAEPCPPRQDLWDGHAVAPPLPQVAAIPMPARATATS